MFKETLFAFRLVGIRVGLDLGQDTAKIRGDRYQKGNVLLSFFLFIFFVCVQQFVFGFGRCVRKEERKE